MAKIWLYIKIEQELRLLVIQIYYFISYFWKITREII